MNVIQPKSRPVVDNRTLDDLFPARFLKPAALLKWEKTSITVTISRLMEEEVQPKPGQTEWKTVLYFLGKNGQEHPQGYLISAKTDAQALQTSTGVTRISDLPGKRIRIFIDEYRGSAVLRIDPAPVS